MAGAKSSYSEITSKSPGLHIVEGAFQTQGAGAPIIVSGAGFTVSAPAAGVYTITLTDGVHPGVLAFSVSLVDSAVNATSHAKLRDNTINVDGKFKIATQSNNGVDANLTGPVVTFIVMLRNTQSTA